VTTKIAGWAKDHPDVAKKWKAANPDAKDDPKDADLVAFFYQDYPRTRRTGRRWIPASGWTPTRRSKWSSSRTLRTPTFSPRS